ncbi:hypothetical protein A3A21_02355 [Candidatus Jorgensenbacteria bacterium RIFCSPLOWO2_01_FULL_45_25b]|uniref:AI-2E family transporter n=1 Tax=Candidatus Jorgensenbacteria bacterium RIFCSPLOWO2_01_FULL_45_25b TaxID=1798471 RepID=A0A1F6BSP5_9BACT|nr:MAG: hypothetical protein A3A21_02355 [Candidatus Jorgensenbacteria bacterium RIFCSPLOWO2_01_FULL_45_25b]
MEEKYHLELSWQALWRIFVFILLIFLLYISRQAIGVLAVAIVVAAGLDPIIFFLEKRGVHRLLGTVLIFLFTLLLFASVLYFILPLLVTEAVGFLGDFNQAISTLFGISFPSSFIKGVSTNLSRVLGFLQANHISVTVAISQILSKSILVLATLAISFYLAVEKNGTERLLRIILPGIYEKPVLSVFARFKVKIRRWLGAQLALSILVGVVVSIGMWLLGVRYPLVLGGLAALFEIVPIIGPVLAGTAAFLVAVPESFALGMYAVLFFVIVQQLENHILIPVIMGRTMKLHPVIVIISLLAGGRAAGFVGVLLAVPIAIFVQETFNYIAERKQIE